MNSSTLSFTSILLHPNVKKTAHDFKCSYCRPDSLFLQTRSYYRYFICSPTQTLWMKNFNSTLSVLAVRNLDGSCHWISLTQKSFNCRHDNPAMVPLQDCSLRGRNCILLFFYLLSAYSSPCALHVNKRQFSSFRITVPGKNVMERAKTYGRQAYELLKEPQQKKTSQPMARTRWYCCFSEALAWWCFSNLQDIWLTDNR